MTHINSNRDELLLYCLFGKISLIIFYLIFHCFNYLAQNKTQQIAGYRWNLPLFENSCTTASGL